MFAGHRGARPRRSIRRLLVPLTLRRGPDGPSSFFARLQVVEGRRCGAVASNDSMVEAAGVEPVPARFVNYLMARDFRRNCLELRCLVANSLCSGVEGGSLLATPTSSTDFGDPCRPLHHEADCPVESPTYSDYLPKHSHGGIAGVSVSGRAAYGAQFCSNGIRTGRGGDSYQPGEPGYIRLTW